MREILYRGRCIRPHAGEWVYGYYYSCIDLNREKRHLIYPVTDKLYGRLWGDVDPETVGQFTGLTDKNGNRIFEGDIVRICSFPFSLERIGEGVSTGCGCVIYKYGRFAVDGVFSIFGTSELMRFLNYDFLIHGVIYSIEIIGNAYDNPELLEVK